MAHAQNTGYDDTALAMPRIDPRGASGVALPQPIPPSQVARIRRIFALQARGDIPAAIRETAELDTSYQPGVDMLGHILADRYLGPSTRPGAEDLHAWLQRWPTLPDAPAMHALLVTRLPRGATPPAAPDAATLPQDSAQLGPVPEESEPGGFTLSRNAGLDRSVREAARAGGAAAVERLLARTAGLTPVYASQLRGEAAQILFTLNRDADAYQLGAAGAAGCRSSCATAAIAGYMAGLAAWRQNRIDLARPMFEQAANAELSTASLRSASAFWAARAQVRTARPSQYQRWMLRAANERRTFYGLLARRALGLDIGFGQSLGGVDPHETLSEADIEAVSARPEGMRAFALIQVGQLPRAEAELRRLWPAATSEPPLGRAIMLVAQRAGLVQLAAQLADLVEAADGVSREATRFPIPRLVPTGGFQVDPAMVYAITRTESNFNTRLVSSAGATGLMQIMPDTASFLIGQPATGALRGQLRDPGLNLDLGQRYVAYLSQHEVVGGDLLRLLASYNAGPGSFGRWGATVRHDGDPLLFIEAIPIDETRAFVPRVLTYTWTYAARMNLPTPSLDELAAGAWPRYHPLNTAQSAQARLH